MSTQTEAAAAPETAAGRPRPRLLHTRCCKAAVPRGLCGCGDTPKGRPRMTSLSPDNCAVCEQLWHQGHWLTCPRDSGYWGVD